MKSDKHDAIWNEMFLNFHNIYTLSWFLKKYKVINSEEQNNCNPKYVQFLIHKLLGQVVVCFMSWYVMLIQKLLSY